MKKSFSIAALVRVELEVTADNESGDVTIIAVKRVVSPPTPNEVMEALDAMGDLIALDDGFDTAEKIE